MAQSVSVGASLAVMRPMEHPAEYLQLLRLVLQGCVALHDLAPVVAVQAQGAPVAEAQAVHPEPAVVQQGIDLAINHAGEAEVDRQDGIARDPRRHVGGRHGHADGFVDRHGQRLQCRCRHCQAVVVDRHKLTIAQFVEGHLHQGRVRYRR